MLADPYLAGVLGKSYLTALLLTGSAEAAEDAVTCAMTLLADSEIEPDSLLLAAIRFALPLAPASAPAAPALPVELERIFLLPSAARRSYVLHVLAGYPAARCAELLGMPPAFVRRHVSDAMLRLAELAHLPTEVAQ